MEVLKRKNTEIEGDVLFKSSRKFPGTNERVFPDGKDLLNVQLRIKGSTLRISRFPEVTRNVPPLGMAFPLSVHLPHTTPGSLLHKVFPNHPFPLLPFSTSDPSLIPCPHCALCMDHISPDALYLFSACLFPATR